MDFIKLDGPTRAGIAARQAIINQQQHILGALQSEFQAFVAKSAGVDLAAEHWELDLEHGLLTRKEQVSGE